MSSLICHQETRSWQGRSLHLPYRWVTRYTISLVSLVALTTVHAPMNGRSLASDAPLLLSQASPTAAATRPTLRLGSQGESVSELQGVLRLLGYYSGPVDGQYQQSTEQAVRSFQQAAGLQPDGIVGPATWQRLLPSGVPVATATPAPAPSPAPAATASPSPSPSPTPAPTRSPAPTAAPTPSPTPQTSQPVTLPILRVGMRGPAVERLQERLRALGYFDGVVDGVFGPQTEAAVQEAQRANDLDPDGVVGPATWTALLRD